MGFDTTTSLQLREQLQQAEAAAGNRLVLRRVNTRGELAIAVIAFILAIPTLTLSFWLGFGYLAIKQFISKTYLVKNVATGEEFRVDKEEFKQYKKEFKAKEKEVRKISDLK